MYYCCCCLVLSVELHFVHFHSELVGNQLTLIFREFPIQHLAECAGDVSHRWSSTADFDVHQIRPLDFVFNLHAYSIVARSPAVNIFCTLFFTFFWAWTWTFAQRIESKSRKIVRKKIFFLWKKRLTRARDCGRLTVWGDPPSPPDVTLYAILV